MATQPPIHRFTAIDANSGGRGVQERCFAYIDDIDPRARAFVAQEQTSRGDVSRVYVAARLDAFLAEYVATPPQHRHVYEIVRGACHLYLDIEHERTSDFSAVRSMRAIVDACAAQLHATYAIARERVRFIVLDASTRRKFSAHVIAKIDDGRTAFRSNKVVERVVADACARLECSMAAAAVDRVVYSRNRQLRIVGSSKIADPERILRAAPACVGGAAPPSDAAVLDAARRSLALSAAAYDDDDDECYALEIEARALDAFADERDGANPAFIVDTLCSLVDADATLLGDADDESSSKSSGTLQLSSSSSAKPSTLSSKSAAATSQRSSSSSTTPLAATPPSPSNSLRCSSDSCSSSTTNEWRSLPVALESLATLALAAHYGRPVALARATSAYNARSHQIRARAVSDRYCPHVQREHRSNVGGVIVDVRQRRARHLCYSSTCASHHFAYASLAADAALARAFDEYARTTPSLRSAASVLSRKRRRPTPTVSPSAILSPAPSL